MTPERWRRVTGIFHAALARTPGDRVGFVATACATDPGLIREVQELLAAHVNGGTFGDSPVGYEARLESGTALGPYVIDRLLGAGGMGDVYKARDTRLDRTVAIKLLSGALSHDAGSLSRFQREARAVAALNHPNICTLHDVGDNYLVMELVEGETLRDRLRQRLPLDQCLGIARQVLAALGAAHRTGIVHRDLKPENVMVRADGYVKVLDFGLATWLPATGRRDTAATLTASGTAPGQILGTIAYMSPEQIEGHTVDQRGDLFAFGIILHEMLAGQHPWPRASTVDTLHAILHDEPPACDTVPGVGPDLAALVRVLLRKHPAERYATADVVLEALASAGPDRAASLTRSIAPKVLTSIAVLPFVFFNDVESSRALSLGFADALITIFANLEDVVVAPTSAILAYPAGADPAGVCRDLGVRHTLQGTVQKLDAEWRVAFQLFDAATQSIALSETYDFSLTRAFDVQDEIGRRVVVALKGRFASATTKTRDRYSGDPTAYGAFMAGLRDSTSGRLETLQAAARHLEEAVEHDPEFALAHATLSLVSMNIHFEFDPQRVWLQRADDHCRRALALDPQLPEGQLARSWILWSPAKHFQHIEAIEALQHVLAARPHLERAHNRMSTICLHIGRLDEARQAHEHALQSNPKTRTGNLEWFYLMSGEFALADEAAEVWFKERPDNLYALFTRVLAALWSGDLDVAEQRLAMAAAALPDEPLVFSQQGMLHARRNQRDLALQCVRRALDSPRSFGHTHHVYHYIASVHALLGDTAAALGWMERSVDTGWACWPFFRIDPHLENLQGEPGFQRLVAELEQTYSAVQISRV
jgi:serine/threonine protein kinase/tetratricopeptide (TPR) repeat protein